jgi:hypothetical protein
MEFITGIKLIRDALVREIVKSAISLSYLYLKAFIHFRSLLIECSSY